MIDGEITPYSSLTLKINKKVQSMINKYCAHNKDVWPLYRLHGDLPIGGFCYKCDSAVHERFVNE